jgi:dTMP kinase
VTEAVQGPLFISFEGVDGTGKTSLLRSVRQYLWDLGHDIVQTREPGSALGGDTIRGMLFTPGRPGPGVASMLPGQADCLLLFDHIGNAEGIVRPALEAGKWVLTDRYADSQFAYCASRIHSKAINVAYQAHFGPVPDITFLLIGDVHAFAARAKSRDANPDAVEPGKQRNKTWALVEQQQRIQDQYLVNLSNHPRTIILDITNMDAQAVANLAIAKLEAWLATPRSMPEQVKLFAGVQ